MKKILALYSAWMLAFAIFAQAQMMPPQDTTLGNTETAAKAAQWLQRLSLPTGTGSIAVLSGFSAQALISDSSKRFADANGMTAYYASPLFQTDLRAIRGRLTQRAVFMRKIGVLAGRDPATFSWGILEPTKGTYNFALIDSLIAVMGDYSVPFIGTIIPFSDWASSCNASQASNMACTNLFSSGTGADYFFINQGKIGPVCDTAALYSFVQRLVERYDGDGIDDMPNLRQPVRYWEFTNEPDGGCGGYGEGKPPGSATTGLYASGYARDQAISYRAMKAACASCQMMNGGAIESFDVTFWNKVLDTILPNKRFIDIANIHVNVGKSASPSEWNWGADFARYFNIFKSAMTKHRTIIPTWITEWGFYSGTPTVRGPGGMTTLPNRTEEEQASIYAKFYAWGKANGMPVIVYDMQGGTDGLTSAALLQTGMGGTRARLAYHSLRMLEFKYRDLDSAQQITFSTAGNISLPEGHIRMFKRGVASDILWGLTALPAGIIGRKVRTDLYGNTDTLDAAQIRFPLAATPIILENVPTASSVLMAQTIESCRISPNPASNLIRVEGYAKEPSLLTVSVMNLLGQELMRLSAEWAAGEFVRTVDISALPQGVFVLRVQAGGQISTHQVSVLR